MKVALVTGGTSDIGSYIVRYLSCHGYDVIFTYLDNYVKAMELSDSVMSQGGNVSYFKCDVRIDSDIDRLYNNILVKYDHLDVIVNNACFYNDDYYMNVSRESFISVVNTNMIGPFFVIQKFNDMIVSDGVVINMLSTDGIDTYNPYSVDYCASKAGLLNITRNLSLGVSYRVVGLAPNYVDTSSVRCMDSDFLASELERIGQKELISPLDVACKVVDIINNKDIISGSIERMD